MKKIYKLIIILVLFFGVYVSVSAASQIGNCKNISMKSTSGNRTGNVGKGPLVYFDKYKLVNDKLIIEGYVYIKGIMDGSMPVYNVVGYNRCFTFNVSGKNRDVDFWNNTTYRFHLQKLDENKYIPLNYKNSIDESTDELAFTYIKRDDIYGEVCEMSGTKCLYGNSQHYMGGFKLIVDFNSDRIDSGSYVLNVAMTVKQNGKTYTLKNVVNTTTINDGNGNAEWINLASPIALLPSSNKQFENNNFVNISRESTADRVQVIVEHGHPYINIKDKGNNTGSGTRDGGDGHYLQDKKTYYVSKFWTKFDFTSKNFSSPGFSLRVSGSNPYRPSASSSSVVAVPASWVRADGDIIYDVTKTPPPNNPDEGKEYNNPTPKSCPENKVEIEKDRVLLLQPYNKPADGTEDGLQQICRGIKFENNGVSVPTLYKNLIATGNNDDDIEQSKKAINDNFKNLLIQYDYTDSAAEELANKLVNYGENLRKNYKYNETVAIISKITPINEISTDASSSNYYNLIFANGNLLESGFKLGEDEVANILISSGDSSEEHITTYMMRGNLASLKSGNSALSNSDLFKRSIVGIESLTSDDYNLDKPGVSAKLSSPFSPDLSNKSISFDIRRQFRTKYSDKNSTRGITDILVDSSKFLCTTNADGTVVPSTKVHDDIWQNELSWRPLNQPTIVDISYCAEKKDDTPPNPNNYDPTPVKCEAEENKTGKYHETEEAYNFTEFTNFDDLKKSDDSRSEDIGFVLIDNKYCQVTCFDDVDIMFPGKKSAYTGATFNLNLYSFEGDNKLPNIEIKRSCYSKMNSENINNYYTALTNNGTVEQGETDNVNACYNFKPGLYSNGETPPEVYFEFDDEKYGNNTAVSKLNLERDEITNDKSNKEIIVSHTNSESISKYNINYDSNYEVSSNQAEFTDIANCQDSGCATDIRNIYYIKKAETKKWSYYTKPYFNSIPSGSVSDTDDGHSVEMNDNNVPVSLTTNGKHYFTLKIDQLTENDTVRKGSNGSSIMEKYENSSTGMYSMDGNNTAEYKCSYSIIPDIIKEREINYIYRTIDVSNMFPNKTKRIGYNWNDSNFFASSIKQLIGDTSDYQKLANNVNGTEGHLKSSINAEGNEILTSDHFSFRLTPSTMKKIRDYNSKHPYNDFSGSLEYDESRDYYWKSDLLECLGNEDNNSCDKLELGNVTNTTKAPELLDISREIIKNKNDTYPVLIDEEDE